MLSSRGHLRAMRLLPFPAAIVSLTLMSARAGEVHQHRHGPGRRPARGRGICTLALQLHSLRSLGSSLSAQSLVMGSIIVPDRGKRDYAPASRGQLVGIVTVALLGAAVGVSMLIIAYISGHLSHAIWVYFIICEAIAVATGIIALILYLRRQRLIIRATRFTMYQRHFQSESPRSSRQSNRGLWSSYKRRAQSESPFSAEDKANYDEAIALRDALISSGDLDLAYRIQNKLTESETN
jgi:MFS family permease